MANPIQTSVTQALPAGTNLIGQVTNQQSSVVISDGTIVPLLSRIAELTTNNLNIIPGTPGLYTTILGIRVRSEASANVQITGASGLGSTTIGLIRDGELKVNYWEDGFFYTLDSGINTGIFFNSDLSGYRMFCSFLYIKTTTNTPFVS